MRKMENKKIMDYNTFLMNEIVVTPLKTDYTMVRLQVPYNQYLKYYRISFETTKGNNYILDIIPEICKEGIFAGSFVLNLSFTIKGHDDITNKELYELETNLREQTDIMKRLIFIIEDFTNSTISKEYNNPIFLIGETDDKRKIDYYRNIIKDSLKEYKEVITVTNDNKKAFYYIKIK